MTETVKTFHMENSNLSIDVQSNEETKFKDINGESKPDYSRAQSFEEFIDGSTIHGVKYIFQKGAIIRRYCSFHNILWPISDKGNMQSNKKNSVVFQDCVAVDYFSSYLFGCVPSRAKNKRFLPIQDKC